MPQNTVRVDDSEVKTALRNTLLAVKTLPARVIRPELEAAAQELATYPAELPGQRYRRTGRRGAATRVRPVAGNNGSSKAYIVESNPVYAGGRRADPYVVGNAYGDGQAAIHQGRWKLLANVVQDAVDRIVDRGIEYFRAAISNGPGGL